MEKKIYPLNPERILNAKIAYTARRVELDKAAKLINGELQPTAGDVLLARVDKIHYHQRIELTDGRKSRLFVDDEIVVCYGNRYAPDQFEALVPTTLAPCHLVASGGVAAHLTSKHDNIKNPTEIIPIGLLADSQERTLNLADFSLKRVDPSGPRPFTVAVAGTSMNSGKTTAAASLIKGLSASGLKVGGAKVSGTGAGGDTWFMRDAGASIVLDFVDAGYTSTYLLHLKQLTEIVTLLRSQLCAAGVDAIVFEVADGLYQEETASLLSSPYFSEMVDGVIFTATDAMGSRAGALWLEQKGLHVLALSGVLTSSPLAIREARRATGLPVLTSKALCSPEIASALLAGRLQDA